MGAATRQWIKSLGAGRLASRRALFLQMTVLNSWQPTINKLELATQVAVNLRYLPAPVKGVMAKTGSNRHSDMTVMRADHIPLCNPFALWKDMAR